MPTPRSKHRGLRMVDSPCTYKGKERRHGCEFADAAADSAVRKTFNILGVDVDDPQQVERFRVSLRFGDKLSKFADKGFFASASILAVFMATLFGLGILSLVADKLRLLKWW